MPYAPRWDYSRETIDGFTVLISPTVIQDSLVTANVRQRLNEKLRDIRRVLPAEHLDALQVTRIWVEWENQDIPDRAATFHPGADWLRNKDYNPEKLGAIEILNAKEFLKVSGGDQPWVLLHELAHAYHFYVLGEADDRNLQDAHAKASSGSLYRQVDDVNGNKLDAYALTNPLEYFAELTEAYFGKNDIYPFVRRELKSYDPDGFNLIERLWKKPS